MSLLRGMKKKQCLLTVKLKVATQSDSIEKKIVSEILDRLPQNSRLRLDANGGWNNKQALSLYDEVFEEIDKQKNDTVNCKESRFNQNNTKIIKFGGSK